MEKLESEIASPAKEVVDRDYRGEMDDTKIAEYTSRDNGRAVAVGRKQWRILIESLKELEELRNISKKPKEKTQKIWKQVRPRIQIEGMIDDGYELIDVALKQK